MAGRHRYDRGLWLRGEQQGQDDDGADAVEVDARPAEVTQPAPSWNDSTMCIQTLRDALVAKGWGKGEVQEIPFTDTAPENELPERLCNEDRSKRRGSVDLQHADRFEDDEDRSSMPR